jgi:hypothetical protein
MADIERRHEIAPVARIGRPDRSRVSQMLDLNESERWLLIAMGGMEFRLPVENWPQIPGLNWLVPREWQVTRPDFRGFDLSRPEIHRPAGQRRCRDQQARLWHLRRGGLQRRPHPVSRTRGLAGNPLVRDLAGHPCARRRAEREQLERGDFVDALHRLWQAPPPALPAAGGATEAAQWLVRELGLG